MYVAVLGVSVSVVVIGLSALMLLRVERRVTLDSADLAQARLHALSAIEMGFFWISDDPDWRTNRADGVWVTDQTIGGGTFTLEVIDPEDGNLRTAPNNLLLLTGAGAQGDARFKLEVTIVPDNGGYVVSPRSWRQVPYK